LRNPEKLRRNQPKEAAASETPAEEASTDAANEPVAESEDTPTAEAAIEKAE